MAKIQDSPAHKATMERWIAHNVSAREAWDSLELWCSFEEAYEFIQQAASFRELPEDGPGNKGVVLGLVLAFAAVMEEHRRLEKQRLRIIRREGKRNAH